MSYGPQTMGEFKNNKFFTLESTIKKYQGFMPSAKPIEDQTFKGEPIYLKKDLSELHTSERWRKHGRQVIKGQKPCKKVKGLYNQPDKLAELYGYWQTIAWSNDLTPDGKIPMVIIIQS